MDRLQEVRNAIIGIVVDEDRAKQRLFGFDVVRSFAIMRFRGLRGVIFLAASFMVLRDLLCIASSNCGFGVRGRGSQ